MVCTEKRESSYTLKDIFLPDNIFNKHLVKLALPIAIQNMTASFLSLLDVIILKKMGDTAIASVSLANQITFVINLVVFGITSGSTIFLSQYCGKEDYQGVRKTAALINCIVFLLTSVVTALCMLFPRGTMRIFTNDESMINLGSQYLLAVSPNYIFLGLAQVYTALFRSINKAGYSMIISITVLSLKTLLNYLFIYGVGIFPALGVIGAGYATVTARFFEFILSLLFLYLFCNPLFHIKKQDYFRITREFVLRFFKTAFPVVINESAWGIGIASFSMIFGRMGESTVTAFNIARTLEELFNSLFYGVACAALVIIGREIGIGNMRNVKLYSRRLSVFGMGVGIFSMIFMLLIRNVYVFTFFDGIYPESKSLASIIILIFALYMPMRSIASVNIMGIMRAGGDSARAMLYDCLPIYVISIPAGVILALLFHLPIYIVLPVMYSKRLIKCVLSTKRVLSDKWINIVC